MTCSAQEVTKTAAMIAGSDLHKALELEVKTFVEIEVITREDAWALRLIECIACLRQLMRKGMTREVYVFGKFQVGRSTHLASRCLCGELHLQRQQISTLHSKII